MSPSRFDKRLWPLPWLGRHRRRRYAISAAILLAAAMLLLADRAGWLGQAPANDFDRYQGVKVTCVNVVDGDTLDVDIPDGKWPHTRIRLWGVDTPESVKPNAPVDHFGPEASRFTRRLAEGQTVRLELLPHDTRGKYGRLLAYVYLPDGTLLNRRLIGEGYGYADPRFTHPWLSDFKREMRRAREARRGLWKDVRPDDLPDYLQR